jgi:hypothetical protein
LRWKKQVKIRHLFTDEENYEAIQKNMSLVADILEENNFPKAIVRELRELPEKRTQAVANDVLEDMYDFADREGIWIE